jgi:hypothetical protein
LFAIYLAPGDYTGVLFAVSHYIDKQSNAILPGVISLVTVKSHRFHAISPKLRIFSILRSRNPLSDCVYEYPALNPLTRHQ